MVNPPRKQRKKEAVTADKHDKTGQAVPPIQSGGPIHTAREIRQMAKLAAPATLADSCTLKQPVHPRCLLNLLYTMEDVSPCFVVKA